jgi:hypothetical protein
MRVMGAALMALALATATAGAEWSFVDHEYSCGLQGMTFQEMACAGVTYVSHVPSDAATAEEAHRWGVRTMPYVSLYKAYDSDEYPGFKTQPFASEIDLAEHSEWALIREDGQRRRPFNNPDYSRGIYQSCCNQPGIAEAYVRGVENVLANGHDGVFVDNVHPYPKCYGPDLGIHQHLFPDKDNVEMYKLALMGVYEAVKAHGPEFAIMLNSGGPRHEYIGYGDTLMWESYVFRHGFAGDSGDLSELRRRERWPQAVTAYERWRDFTEAGGSIAPLCYHPVREEEKRHSFLSYAMSMFAGLRQWSGTARERQDILRQLHRVQPGEPAGPPVAEPPLYYRAYDAALVAGNGGDETIAVNLPWHLDSPEAVDLYSGETLRVRDGQVRVTLPPDSGRVYVTPAAYLANCLGETTGMAQSCLLRLEEMAEAASSPEMDRARAMFTSAHARAQACLRAARREGVPTDADGKSAIAGLADALDEALGETTETAVADRLVAGTGVTAQDLPDLLSGGEELPFEVVVDDAGVLLRSAGARFSFRDEGGNIAMRLGPSSLALWVTKNALAEGDGWYDARRVEDAEVTVDEPDRKTVEFTIKLFGRDSGRDVDALDVRVAASIERSQPAVKLRTALRNHTGRELPGAYWFWNIGGRWHSFPDGTTTATPGNREAPGESGWEYLHDSETGGAGVVLSGHANMGYTGSQFHMFAEPKAQDIEPGGEIVMNWTTRVVNPTWQQDEFIVKRARWYPMYASKAAEVTSGLRVEIDAPGALVAGADADVTVRIGGRAARHIDDAGVKLTAMTSGRALEVTDESEVAGRRRRFVVHAPANLEAGSRVELCATLTADDAPTPAKIAAFEALRVRSAVQLVQLRQSPGPDGALAFALTLRNNLTRPLPVEVTVRAEGASAGNTSQTLMCGEDAAVVVTMREATVSAVAEKLVVRTTVEYELGGERMSVESSDEIALLPQAVCETASNPPTIDGRLDDSPWTFATKLGGFVDHQTGEPARERTTVYVVCDDANLYLGFDLEEEAMSHLTANAKPDEHGLNPAAVTDDSVEIYVDPRRPGLGFFRLALNSLGAAKSSHDGGWEVATEVGEAGWTVEVRIPFDLIGARPDRGEVWGFNACRNDQGSGQASAWSCTRGGYAKPERFGGLMFSP